MQISRLTVDISAVVKKKVKGIVEKVFLYLLQAILHVFFHLYLSLFLKAVPLPLTFSGFVAQMLHQTQKELFIESFASYFFGSSRIKLATRHLKNVYQPSF